MASTLVFRNVDVNVTDPVETWPVEAMATALARGGLSDWRRVLSAIRREPWGSVARVVEQVLTYERPYGTAELFESGIARARASAEAAERQAVAQQMQVLVRSSGLTQAEFASRLGTSRSRLSTYLSGRVVPSATLLLRAQRVSAMARGSG
jgi:DNA-binding transcriptional regulator YiaG